MNINEMTDEAIALMSADLDATRADANYASHTFGGIDRRCWDCDTRPHAGHRYPC